MENSSKFEKWKKRSKMWNKIWVAALALATLVWCDDKSNTENDFAYKNDVEARISQALKQYSEDNPWLLERQELTREELEKMDEFWKRMLYVLSMIEWVQDKIVIVDVDWATWIRLNEIFKNAGYNTTMNYQISWNENWWQAFIDYSKLFAVAQHTQMTPPDKHETSQVDWELRDSYNTKPWVIFYDYNRTPWDNVNVEMKLDEWYFPNYYLMWSSEFPDKSLLVGTEDTKPVRDWIIVLSPDSMNQDLREYVEWVYQVNPEVKFVTYGNDQQFAWVDMSWFESFVSAYEQFNRELWTEKVTIVDSDWEEQEHATIGNSGFWIWYMLMRNNLDPNRYAYSNVWSSYDQYRTRMQNSRTSFRGSSFATSVRNWTWKIWTTFSRWSWWWVRSVSTWWRAVWWIW